MGAANAKPSSIDLLEAFWRRQTFHDMAIEGITALNRRVLIRLEAFTLVVTQASRFTKEIEEFPTSWLSHEWTERGNEFVLHVDVELGRFEVTGRDLRLIRNDDLAVLIPAIDA